jgi:hypothetical protein
MSVHKWVLFKRIETSDETFGSEAIVNTVNDNILVTGEVEFSQ